MRLDAVFEQIFDELLALGRSEPFDNARGNLGPDLVHFEQLLFGGPLRYDLGWNKHQDAFLHLGLRSMVKRLPHLLVTTGQLAWQADKRALRLVACAEIGRWEFQFVVAPLVIPRATGSPVNPLAIL